ncbi:uncharacterized protein A4U43_C08F19850 [Asparagus officinalis]|nr:uncharacterized protein A4U43_C08F19850 [Asparagus officinalis]
MEVREQMIEGLKASDAQKSYEIDRLKRELQGSNKKARHLFEQRLPSGFEEARESTKKKVAALEAERVSWSQNEGKLCQKLEMREDIIKGLQGLYPPQVTSCLEFLKELKSKRGGIALKVDDRDDEDESGDDQEEVVPSAAQHAFNLKPSASLLSPTPNLRRDA